MSDEAAASVPSTSLARLGRIELYSILPAGFLIFSLILFAVVAFREPNAGSLGEQLAELGDAMSHWPAPLLVFLLSYVSLLVFATSFVLGSLPRAIPVGLADEFSSVLSSIAHLIVLVPLLPLRFVRLINDSIESHFTKPRGRNQLPSRKWGRFRCWPGWGKIVGPGWPSGAWERAVRDDRFPFPRALRLNLRGLQKSNCVGSHLPVIPKDPAAMIVVFDCWKSILRVRVPTAYAHVRSLEGRVRMFVGLFWAGLLGIVVGASVLVFRSQGWSRPSLVVMLVSAAMFIAFGSRVRHVRAEEANEVLLAYLCYLQSPSDRQTDGLSGNSPGPSAVPEAGGPLSRPLPIEDPSPEPGPPSLEFRRRGRRVQGWLWGHRLLREFVVPCLGVLVPPTLGCDLGVAPGTGLHDPPAFDLVVGPAALVPVAHRGPERDSLPVVDHLPVGRRERGHDLLAASAAAAVRGAAVLNRDVEHPWLQLLRDVLDEAVLKAAPADHARSPFSSWFPSVV